MVYFTISGRPNCPFYSHALYVAYFLEDNLPNFKVMKQDIDQNVWTSWLRKMNDDYGWHHKNSPIIWKTLTMTGAKPYYIGSLSEFWEYCYDYFNLESVLPKQELKQLVADMTQYYNHEQYVKENKPLSTSFIMSIIGGTPKLVWNFLSQALDLKFFNDWDIIKVKIYVFDNDEIEKMESVAVHFEEFPIECHVSFNVYNDLGIVISGADLVLILGDYTREEDEPFKVWLDRNYDTMLFICDELNKHAKPDLRVVLGMHGPVCFNATILHENCKTVQNSNLVAVTADLGLEALALLKTELDVLVETLGAPPVWGFAGINHVIDIHHIVQKYDVFRPNKHAMKMVPDSTMISGKKTSELRFLGYLTYDLKDFFRKLKKRKEYVKEKLGRTTYFPKIRAIVNLLKNWYDRSKTENIISLGIYWEGDELSPGINFSMPVTLDLDTWIPVKEFPKPQKDIVGLEDFLPFVYDILVNYEGRNAMCACQKSISIEPIQIDAYVKKSVEIELKSNLTEIYETQEQEEMYYYGFGG